MIDHPLEEQYRRVRMANKTFSEKVWQYPEAQQFLLLSGWVEAGEFVVYIEDSASNLQNILDSMKSCKSQFLPSSLHVPVVPQTLVTNSQDTDTNKGERLKKLREDQKRIQEEKKRISAQIKSDRHETNQREPRISQARVMTFGSNIKKFEDIGIDLNKQGG